MQYLRIPIAILWALVNLFVSDFWYYALEESASENLRLFISAVWLVAWFIPWAIWITKVKPADTPTPVQRAWKPERMW